MEENLRFRKVFKLYFYNKRKILEKFGLFRGQPPILFILGKEDGQTQKELADKMEVNPATICKMVNRMEKNGFITKKKDKVDKRITRVYLTPYAIGVKSEVEETVDELEKKVFKGFDKKEIDQLNTYFERMIKNLHEK